MLKIIFGTESGNAEMAAEDMVAALYESGIEATAVAMDIYDVAQITQEEHVILMASTYGEGELPMTAVPFYESLKAASPNLSGLKFSALGLGDSSYETYNQGIKSLIYLMKQLGAVEVGETGFHDATLPYSVSDMAVCWASRQFIVA